MKEMCQNFICNTRKCPAQPAASDAQRTQTTQTAQTTQNARTTMVSPATTALQPDTDMGDCNACVLERVGLAQAFVADQPYEALMEQEQSLVCGTAFSALVMPYCSGWNLYRFGKEM